MPRRIRVIGGDHGVQVAEVADAGQSEDAGPPVQQVVDLVRRHPCVAQQVEHHAGVDVTAAGAHHQALQRRQAHRRLDRGAEADGRRRGAVSQVQDDLLHLCRVATQHGRRQPGDVLVRGAVEAVPPDLLFGGHRPVDRVGRGGRRQIAEERGVEDRHLRDAREGDHCLRDPVGVGRVVQRREPDEVADLARSTASSTITGSPKTAPPCTTRWPTATSRPSPAAARASANSCCMTVSARAVVGDRTGEAYCSPPRLVGGRALRRRSARSDPEPPHVPRPGRSAGTSWTTSRN